MSESGTGRPGSEQFEEAIARWQLHVQTEVKRVSALPTAMFDACDPMLEATLASVTERILATLSSGGPASIDIHPATLHLEQVSKAELQALRQRLSARAPEPPDLGEGAPEELLSVLVDLCHTGEPKAREEAARHLCQHLEVTPAELEQLTGDLATALQRWLRQDESCSSDLELACQRVARNVAPLLVARPEGAR